MNIRAALSVMSAIALMTLHGVAGAQPGGSADSVNARLIMGELQKEGFIPKLDKDDDGEPRLAFKVDGYDWAIYFYTCGEGPNETRPCASYQLYTGYVPDKPISLATINRWNSEKRYVRAHNYVQRDGKTSSRLEIDVLAEGTHADRAETFQLFFKKMKEAAQDFRKLIGVN